MKLSRVVLLGILVVLFASAVHADTIAGDPQIIILGVGEPGTFPVTSLNFSFSTSDGINCTIGTAVFNCKFLDAAATNFFSLRIVIDQGFSSPSQVDCTSVPSSIVGAFAIFSSCDVQTSLTGPTIVTFFGGNIPLDTEFIIFHGDSSTPLSNRWPASTTFDATANVPEPATLSLFLAGVGALVARRRMRKALIA